MKPAEHTALINELSTKVAAGPQTPDNPGPHFQSCWSLIKRIGPAFKEVVYPDSRTRNTHWDRFQKTVATVKAQQNDFEKVSAELRRDLLGRIQRVDPAQTMEELAGPAPGEAKPEGTPAGRRKARLEACNDECRKILDTFMAAKGRLTPTHYKEISDALRTRRQSVQKAWDGFKAEARAHHEQIQVRKEAQQAAAKAKSQAKGAAHPGKGPQGKGKTAQGGKPHGGAPRKAGQGGAAEPGGEPSVKALPYRIEEDQFLLDHKKGELASLEKSWASSADVAHRARTEKWIASTRIVIEELEKSIAGMRARL